MEQLLSNELLEWLQSDIEVDVDPLLLAASNSYKKSLCPSNEPSPLKTFLHVRCSGIPAAPKTEEEICNARAKGVPSKTIENTQILRKPMEWVEKVLPGNPWRLHPRPEVQHWLTRFVLEVQKKDSSEFVPNMVHHICCGLMHHLRWNGQHSIDFFLPTVTLQILIECRMPKWKGCRVRVGSKTGRSIHVRRWGATAAEGSPVWCYPTDTCRHHGLHEWPLFCSLKWQRVHTDNWGLVLARLKSSKNKERPYLKYHTEDV